MLNYGIGYPGDDELDPMDPIDKEIIERRTREYEQYLEMARDRGSIDAMMLLSSRYMRRNSKKSRKEAFALQYAYAWYRRRYEGNDGSFKSLRRIGFEMSAVDYYEAVEMGKHLLSSQQCCFKIPEVK